MTNGEARVGLGRDDLVLCAGTVMATPFLDRLGAAAANGFTGVGIMPFEYHALRQQGVGDAEIRSRIADHGLRVGELDAITTWFDGHEPPAAWGVMGEGLRHNTAANVCPVGEALGARSVTVVEFYGIDVDVDRAAEGFAAVCDKAADHGLLAHLEFLPWAGIPDLAAAWAIVQRAGRSNGGILLDSWHLFRSGSTLDELRQIPGDRILNIQLDDAPSEPEAELSDETQHRRLLPGEGSFDLIGLIQTLDAIGCTAPIGVEVFSDAMAPLTVGEIAARCATATRGVLSRARA